MGGVVRRERTAEASEPVSPCALCLFGLVPLHVGEEVVNPGVVEDQTDGGGNGSDAENRGNWRRR
jgi:hypothetical protein